MRSQTPGEWWTAGWPVWAWKREGVCGGVIFNSKHNSGSDSHYKDINTCGLQTYAGILSMTVRRGSIIATAFDIQHHLLSIQSGKQRADISFTLFLPYVQEREKHLPRGTGRIPAHTHKNNKSATSKAEQGHTHTHNSFPALVKTNKPRKLACSVTMRLIKYLSKISPSVPWLNKNKPIWKAKLDSVWSVMN